MFTKNNNNMNPKPKRDKNEIFAIIFAFLIILWTVASFCSIASCARDSRKRSSSTITASAQSLGDYYNDVFRIDLPMLNTIIIHEEGFGNSFTCNSHFQLVLENSYAGITNGYQEIALIANSSPISYDMSWKYNGDYMPMLSQITFSSSNEPLASIFKTWGAIEIKYTPLLTSSSIDYAFDIEFIQGDIKRVYSFSCSVALPRYAFLNEEYFNTSLPLGHYVWDEGYLEENVTDYDDLYTRGFTFFSGDYFYESTYFVGVNYDGYNLTYQYAPQMNVPPRVAWQNNSFTDSSLQDFYIVYFGDEVPWRAYELLCRFATFHVGTISCAEIGPSGVYCKFNTPFTLPVSASAMGLTVAEGSVLYFSNDGGSGSLSFDEGFSAGYISGKTDWFNAGKAEGYEVGKTDGIEIGREEGLEEGESIGFGSGFEAGKQTGFDEGYVRGVADSNEYTFMGLFSSVIDAPVQAFTGLFNFDLLGINLSSFFLALLTAGVCLAILRLII